MGSLFRKRSSPIAPPPTPPLPLPLVGLGTHSLLQHDLLKITSLGVKRIRFPLYWHLWETDPAYKDWTARRLDAACDEFGFQVLVVVHGEGPDFTDKAVLRLLDFLPRRFPRVEAWQVLNEKPLHASGWNAAVFHDRAHWTVKAANARALVVTMAMDPESEWGKNFLGYAGPLDAIAIHVYGWPTADHMRRRVAAARATSRPVWVTEYGSAASIIPPEMHGSWEAVQCTEIAGATEAARGAERAYIYQYQTDELGQHSAGETHGIVRLDGSLRPAAHWLRDHLATAPQH